MARFERHAIMRIENMSIKSIQLINDRAVL